jgi:long-chain acyl-CoA synthetase
MGHLIGDVAAASTVLDGRPGGLFHYTGVAAYGLLRHAAQTLPDRTAIRYGHQSWTYGQLNYDAVRCAAMLQRLGLRPGERVGVLLPNVPEFIIAANGIWRAGGVMVALSPLMVQREVRELITKTSCRFVICLDMLVHLVGESSIPGHRNGDAHSNGDTDSADVGHVVEKTLLVSIREHLPALQRLGYLWARRQRTGFWSLPAGRGLGWFWEEVDRTEREWIEVSIDPAHDAAYILPTGGTTGHPKAVTLSHENLVANAWQQYVWTDRLFGTESMLAVLPFFHSYGMSATVMGGAALGATLVLHHRFNTRQVIRLIEEHRPTVFHAVPAMLAAMNERLQTHPADLRSLRWVISGGAPLEPEIAAEFTRHSGALVVEGYGLSEASPVTHVGPLYRPPRYGTIGMPLPETDARIVDQNDVLPSGQSYGPGGPPSLASGEVGELVIRGPQVMLGYWQAPEATGVAIRDGWLHTGDLATVDEDGYFRIVGRKKDLIITSGFNVYPAEVEEVLCRVPGVAGAAVIGVYDHACGEIVKAIVQLEPGVKWDEKPLREACETHLAKHKRPKIYRWCQDELPRNFLGKLIRRHLRDEHRPEGGNGDAKAATPDVPDRADSAITDPDHDVVAKTLAAGTNPTAEKGTHHDEKGTHHE